MRKPKSTGSTSLNTGSARTTERALIQFGGGRNLSPSPLPAPHPVWSSRDRTDSEQSRPKPPALIRLLRILFPRDFRPSAACSGLQAGQAVTPATWRGQVHSRGPPKERSPGSLDQPFPRPLSTAGWKIGDAARGFRRIMMLRPSAGFESRQTDRIWGITLYAPPTPFTPVTRGVGCDHRIRKPRLPCDIGAWRGDRPLFGATCGSNRVGAQSSSSKNSIRVAVSFGPKALQVRSASGESRVRQTHNRGAQHGPNCVPAARRQEVGSRSRAGPALGSRGAPSRSRPLRLSGRTRAQGIERKAMRPDLLAAHVICANTGGHGKDHWYVGRRANRA